jgi:hypothetical protein
MGAAPAPLAPLHRHADTAGVTASVLCLIHCLATPVIISLFPDIIPYLPGDAWFHRLLAVGILLCGLAGFVPGYRIHRRRSLLALIVAGITLILVVACSGEGLNRNTELVLSVTGSLLLVTAHLLNRSFCLQCRACSDSAQACATTSVE